MKKIQFISASPLVLAALAAFLFSFSFLPGAHSFQVYLDGKLLVDQYVTSKMEMPTLRLDPAGNQHQLTVKYNECGRTVTGRKLFIKDNTDKVLKEWRFEGATSGYKESMTCNIKDIVSLKQKGSALKLYYSSSDFQEGQQIAQVLISGEPKAALK
jgi:hypothetical protein